MGIGIRWAAVMAVLFAVAVNAGCLPWDKELPDEAAQDSPAEVEGSGEL